MSRRGDGEGLGARKLALAVLERVERDRAWAEAVLGHELDRAGLPVRERTLAARLVYGCLAWRGYLDWHIDLLCPTGAQRLKPEVRQLLRLGLFQMLLLDRVPDYAAVSTTVNLAKRRVPWAAGFINAVLRRAARESASAKLPPAAADLGRHLAIAYSHPQWMVSLWLEEPQSVGASGATDVAALLAANNRSAPTVLRVPGGETASVVGKLENAGLAARPGKYSPQALVLEGPLDLPFVTRICGPAVVIQAEASQLIAHLLAPRRASSALDACAGPGGKGTHIAELGGPRLQVVAMDIRKAAAARVARLARRLGASNLHVLVGDARRSGAMLGSVAFDRVLVDAPCSGLGTLRSHPELRWSRTSEAIAALAKLQLEILRGVSPLVRPDGILVYATCTLTEQENEGVVRAFLDEQVEFHLEDPRADLPPSARSLVAENGVLRTLPHRHDLDGFFAVRLRRRSKP